MMGCKVSFPYNKINLLFYYYYLKDNKGEKPCLSPQSNTEANKKT